jgi:DNA-binding MarR family transcriptional regulator
MTQGHAMPTDARLFAHPRLEIAAAIARRAGISFRMLCEELGLSDGNLSAHLRALENESVIEVQRGFDGRRRLSQYRFSVAGHARFRAYVGWVQHFTGELSAILSAEVAGASETSPVAAVVES